MFLSPFVFFIVDKSGNQNGYERFVGDMLFSISKKEPTDIHRCRQPDAICKKCVFRNFATFTEKH